MNISDIVDQIRVTPGQQVCLDERDPGWAQSSEWKTLGKDATKGEAKQILDRHLEELAQAQRMLYASSTQAVLIILQGMDASGKDGLIRHVMSGINPQGCHVHSFKQPTEEESAHHFLWRCSRVLPARGQIGVFNRSYYEEVLIVRVHPHWLERQAIPSSARTHELWQGRYEDINSFEKHLTRNGTVILKFFLHISKAEQLKRFLARLDNREKHWKFSAADLAERDFWADYQSAYEQALSATSTEWAPWYVIPADSKWVARTLVADVMVKALRSLKLTFPETTPQQQQDLALAREKLLRDIEQDG